MTKKEKIFSCCHHCEEKFEACHDVCASFLQAEAEWRELQNKIKEAKKKVKEYEYYHHDRITQQYKIKRNKNGR